MPLPSQSSPFAAVLAATVSRLASALGVSPAFVQPVAADDYRVTEAEPLFAYVRVYGPRPATDAGAGRLGRLVERRLRVYLYTRTGEDVYGTDPVALQGADADRPAPDHPPTPGHLVCEEVVYDALDDWIPAGPAGYALTVEPLHALDSAAGPPERDPENEAGLVRSALDFSATYVLAIDRTEPAP